MTLPTGAWSIDDFNATWDVVRWFLGENMMWIMMVAAIFLAYPAMGMIIYLFNKATAGNRKNDDDDIEYW